MEKLLIGVLELSEAEKEAMKLKAEKQLASSGGMPIIPFLIVVLAIAAYFYLESQK